MGLLIKHTCIFNSSSESADLTNAIHPFVHIGFGLCCQIVRPLRCFNVKHVRIILLAVFESESCIHLKVKGKLVLVCYLANKYLLKAVYGKFVLRLPTLNPPKWKNTYMTSVSSLVINVIIQFYLFFIFAIPMTDQSGIGPNPNNVLYNLWRSHLGI